MAKDWGGIGREIYGKYYGKGRDECPFCDSPHGYGECKKFNRPYPQSQERFYGEPLGTGLSQARTTNSNTFPSSCCTGGATGGLHATNCPAFSHRTPLSEYSDEELKLQLNLHGYVVLQEPEYNYFAKEATDHLRCGQKKVRWDKKCYKPCCAAKPEPIDWSDSWNEDIDDHPRR